MRATLLVCLLSVTGLQMAAPRAAVADDTLEGLLRRGLAYLEKAQVAFRQGKPADQRQYAKQAEGLFLSARRLADRDIRIWFLGCQAAAFRGDRGAAADWYEGYRARNPQAATDPDLQFLQGFIYIFGADNPDRAVASLRRMRALDPKRRPLERDALLYIAHTRFGNALLGKNDEQGAVKQYMEGARVSRRRGWASKELSALGNAGIAMELATDWKRAAELFRMLRKRNPENVLWHWHLGLCLASQYKFREALPVYRKVIEFVDAGKVGAAHKSEIDRVFMRYGNSLRQVAEKSPDPKRKAAMLADAEKYLKRYIERHPKDPRGFRWLAELYAESLARPYDAIEAYETSLALDPVCGDVPLRSLAQLYRRNPPPPGKGTVEERQAAWDKQRAAYEKARDDGKEARAKARLERERKSPVRSDGCD